MPTYIVTTKSTFENVYKVEASSEIEAKAMLDDTYNFYQKHIGEDIIDVSIKDPDTDHHKDMLNKGYF